MSGASLTIGGFALIMTIVCQFLWAGMLFWKCLAFWKAMSAVFASLIFLVLHSPLCTTNGDEESSCKILIGGYLIIISAIFWLAAGLFGGIFSPPNVPSPHNLNTRVTTTMANGESMDITQIKEGSSPFSGVSY